MRIFNKMKKAMLVMMASLFCANVAFAEVKTGSYAVVADDIASGAQITSVEGITMTFGTSETWTSGSGKVTVDGAAFNVYASTSENCSPSNGAIPTAGPYVVFTPQFNGTVTGIVSNAGNNKNGYIVKDEDNNLVNGTVLIDGAEVAWESGTPYNSAAKYNGGVTFEVEGGATYYFYMAGSKMRFNGFIYTYEEVEIPEVPAEPVVEKVYDFAALQAANANKTTMTYSDETINIGGTDSNLGTGEYEGLAMQAPDKWFLYTTGGLYQGNGGGRKIGVLNLKAKQEVIVVASEVDNKSNVAECLVLADETNATQISVENADGKNTFTYKMKTDGNLALTMSRYFTLYSITIVTPPAPVFNLTVYNEAVAAAEAFKAILAADTYFEKEIIEELIVAIDEAIVYAKEGVDAAASQEDVTIATDMLNETVGMYKSTYDGQVIGMKIEEARMAGQEALAKYPEESRSDNAGLVEALMNLPMRTMGYTVEQLQAALDAVLVAIPAFEKENNQLILDAAKKKANDYAATLDASEETGTMAQIQAYNGLIYYTSDEFFAESGITADSYDMVMSYSQQIDMMIAQYDPAIQKEKNMMAATKAAAEAQEVMASYEGATDNAGLAAAITKVNDILSELNMWDTMYTIEDLNAAVDALAAARVAFEKENSLGTGTYWLKNVASGKFITAGESWGTCAVFGEHGLDFEFALQDDGTYIIDSKLSNGGESHYFGAEGWMDAAATKWTIARMPGGAYTITANGSNFLGYDEANVWNTQTKVSVNMTDNTAEAAQWIIMSKDKMIASLEGASVANPADATFFISCANFGRNDTRFTTAWQGAPARGGNNDNMAGEKWNTNFDVYQDLAGLPNGYYKLSAQGYYRAGNGGATGMERNAYLYAGANKTPLVNINTEAGNSVFEGGNVSTVAGMGIVPNNMNTATTGFTAGLYADNSVIAQVTDGTLRIGVKKDVLIANDWTMFDNFELTYYGTELPPVVADGTYYMKNVASGKFLNGGNSWGTQASLADNGFDATLTYSNGTYTIDTNVPNGASRHFLGSNGYVDSDVANWKIVPAGENYAITLDGVNYIGYDGATSVMALNLTDAANTAAQWQFITKDELVAALDGATEANPGNATFFIVGQNFNRGDANRNAAWQGSPDVGGINENFAGEKFNTNFDVYQELTGLPAGYYELSAQAYYRAGGNDVLVANKDSKNAVLYAGINSVPVMGILDEVGQEGMPNDVNIEGYGQVPNGMGTAAQAFTAGLYADNKVVALVTDGTLRVGIKKDVTIANDWTMFDNFQLAYLGTAVPSVFADAVDSLNTVIADANAWKATLDATNEIEAQVIAQIEQGMMPAAQAVAAQPASIAQIEEMIASVNMFLLQTQSSVAQYKAMEAMQLLAEYENPKDNVGFEEAYNEVFMIANGLATGTYTWADVEVAIAKMNAAKELFVLQNVPVPAVEIVNVLGKHRLVALTCDHVVPVEIFYSYDKDMAKTAIYTAPFYVSETTTVYAYAQFIDEDRVRYASDVVAIEIEAGEEVALNAPVVEKTEAGNIKITTDQTQIAGTPNDTIEYLFYPQVEEGVYAINPSASGYYTEELTAEMLGGSAIGKIVAKAIAFGYTTSETVQYLVGETEVTLIEATDNPFGIEGVEAGQTQWPADIYDINGRMIKKAATSLEGLEKGLYFIKGQKVLVK